MSMKTVLFALFLPLLLCAAPAAADVGDAPEEAKAAYRRGVTLQRLGDVPRAIEQYRVACEAGDPRGCLSAADNVRAGNTVPQDFAAAMRLYDRACEGNLGAGCSGAGYMAFKGLGQSADASKALKHYEDGCALGDQSGCAGAGNILITGAMGARRDRAAGADLLRGACKADYDWACGRLTDLGQTLKLGQ